MNLAMLSHHQVLFCTMIGFFSLMIGSLLNILIYRYPLMLKNMWYKECQNFLTNPNVSSGTTSSNHDQNKISQRFLFIELLTAVLTVLVVIHFGFTKTTLMMIVLTWGLIVLSIIDINEQLLPDAIIYCLLWLGLVCNIFHYFVISSQAIFGAIAGYIVLWFVAKFFYLARKKEGMGHGDFKMLAMIGAWVGINNLLSVLFISVVLALFFNIPLIITKRMTKESTIPFGPFLAIGGWVTLMFGPVFFEILK